MNQHRARQLIRSRERVTVRIAGGDRHYLQIVGQSGPQFGCLVSTTAATQILEYEAEDLVHVAEEATPAPVGIEPLVFSTNESDRILVEYDGHNGIAEAVLLLRGYRARFGYQKPKSTTVETRHVRIKWIDGERFGGADHDRNMAGRSFRLDRVKWIELHPESDACPTWTGEQYERGMP